MGTLNNTRSPTAIRAGALKARADAAVGPLSCTDAAQVTWPAVIPSPASRYQCRLRALSSNVMDRRRKPPMKTARIGSTRRTRQALISSAVRWYRTVIRSISRADEDQQIVARRARIPPAAKWECADAVSASGGATSADNPNLVE